MKVQLQHILGPQEQWNVEIIVYRTGISIETEVYNFMGPEAERQARQFMTLKLEELSPGRASSS